ncbi:hypothetical protein [Roseobacter sp.]|uniref:hypothetical protein n=1 Tax=Roseobacter sp. TaxID=1907202 RepID=UPI00329969CE
MSSGLQRICIIPWSQTELDGLDATAIDTLEVGTAWSWRGDATQIGDPSDIAAILGRMGQEKTCAMSPSPCPSCGASAPDIDPSGGYFIVSNGAKSYRIGVVFGTTDQQPMVMFDGETPPRNTDLWVVEYALPTVASSKDGDVVCLKTRRVAMVPWDTPTAQTV